MFLLLALGCSAPTDDTGVVPTVRLETSLGAILLELNPEAAPQTVDNFLAYIDDGFYDGSDGAGATVFHRVEKGFVIQGGGLTADLALKATRAPVPNESDSGLSNVRGTVAMARLADPDSATAQFFVNLDDNAFLDAGAEPGYAVFARVTAGMEIVDAIAELPVEARDGLTSVPLEPPRIEQATRR